jgi:hypothetical protein
MREHLSLGFAGETEQDARAAACEWALAEPAISSMTIEAVEQVGTRWRVDVEIRWRWTFGDFFDLGYVRPVVFR